jgi:CDP-diacylglycerol--glycerol-3-phosphate 3-phosphatidyltransferase
MYNHKNDSSVKIITFPNLLSVSRIVLSPLMFILWDNRWMLFLLFLVIGLTDIVDGYVARKLKNPTVLGAWLDSIADFVFFISYIVLAVIFEADHIIALQYLIGIIILTKLLSGFTGLLKYKQPGFLHTIGNKIACTVIISGICFFVLFRNMVIVKIGLYMSILSALEEFLIMLIGNTYKPNIKGFWEIERFKSRV